MKTAELTRLHFHKVGIFGNLSWPGSLPYCSLEHSYLAADGASWTAKVAPGEYAAVRHAPNRLPYETFMLQDVPDFQGQPVTGILIHKADFPGELEGCIAPGMSMTVDYPGRIYESKKAFDAFMSWLDGESAMRLIIR